jgi:hypothetical protein
VACQEGLSLASDLGIQSFTLACKWLCQSCQKYTWSWDGALWTCDQGHQDEWRILPRQILFTTGAVPMVMLTRWREVVFMSR